MSDETVQAFLLLASFTASIAVIHLGLKILWRALWRMEITPLDEPTSFPGFDLLNPHLRYTKPDEWTLYERPPDGWRRMENPLFRDETRWIDRAMGYHSTLLRRPEHWL